jgi:lipopolysaccharide transport system permease protein
MSAQTKTMPQIRVILPVGEPLSVWGSLSVATSEIYLHREVIWQLFKRDLISQFQQKILGYLWLFVNPLLAIASFIFMSFAGILSPGDTAMPYVLFALVGTTLWNVLVSTITAMSTSLTSQSELILKTNIPKVVLAVSSLANIVHLQIINFVLIVFFSFAIGFQPGWGLLLYPLLILPILFFGVGVGLVIAVVNAVARDISSVATTLLNLYFFLCPIAYVMKFKSEKLNRIARLNPMFYLIDGPRNYFYSGHFGSGGGIGFALATLFSLGLLFMGVHIFLTLEDKVAERL